jgi:peptidoglycan/LPS O-acetylase OafA/YrhL
LVYRAEIDGLRAISVIAIVLLHAGFGLFSGGFIGVDIFFVISGYLITTILIEDIVNTNKENEQTIKKILCYHPYIYYFLNNLLMSNILSST